MDLIEINFRHVLFEMDRFQYYKSTKEIETEKEYSFLHGSVITPRWG